MRRALLKRLMKRNIAIAAVLAVVVALSAFQLKKRGPSAASFDPIAKFQSLAAELDAIQAGRGDEARFRQLLIETSDTIDDFEGSKPADPIAKLQAIGFRSHLALTMNTIGMRDEAKRLMQRSLDESEALRNRFPSEPHTAELVTLVEQRRKLLLDATK